MKFTEREEFDLAKETTESSSLLEESFPQLAAMNLAQRLRLTRNILAHALAYMTLHHYPADVTDIEISAYHIEKAFKDLQQLGYISNEEAVS